MKKRRKFADYARSSVRNAEMNVASTKPSIARNVQKHAKDAPLSAQRWRLKAVKSKAISNEDGL